MKTLDEIIENLPEEDKIEVEKRSKVLIDEENRRKNIMDNLNEFPNQTSNDLELINKYINF